MSTQLEVVENVSDRSWWVAGDPVRDETPETKHRLQASPWQPTAWTLDKKKIQGPGNTPALLSLTHFYSKTERTHRYKKP